MKTKCFPDLSDRPLTIELEGHVTASPTALFEAWSSRLDCWFGAPETFLCDPRVDGQWYFEAHREGKRHPHYGRFLELEKDRLVEMAWMSEGTRGSESVVRVELVPQGDRTLVKIQHSGFPDQESADKHKWGWGHAFEALDKALK